MEAESPPPSAGLDSPGTPERLDEMRRRTIAELQAEVAILRKQNATLTQDLNGAVELIGDLCRKHNLSFRIEVRSDSNSPPTQHADSLE